MTHHVATHKAQHAPGEVHDKALTDLDVQVPCMNNACHHQDLTMNMDQIPVYHSMDQDYTINFVGTKTIIMRSMQNDCQHVTVSVTITASGERVMSMVVFKGKL